MQAVKDKLSEMNEMRKAKAEAKAVEQEEKELAKARVGIAKEIRKAREAEAAMDIHVEKAAEKAERQIAKHQANIPHKEDNNVNIGGGAGAVGAGGGVEDVGPMGGGVPNYDEYNATQRHDELGNTTDRAPPMEGQNTDSMASTTNNFPVTGNPTSNKYL